VSGEFSIAYRVLNVLVAEVVLYCFRVLPVIGELVAAGVPEHVRVDGKGEVGGCFAVCRGAFFDKRRYNL